MTAAGPARQHGIAGRLAFSNGDIAVRALAAADGPFDRMLFDEDRGVEFLPLGLDPAMLAMLLDQQFRAQQIGYRTAFPDAENFIIEHVGEPVGRLTTAMGVSGESRTLHIVYIVLSSAARGRGIGTDVLTALAPAAAASGATRLALSVRDTNIHARRLYERLGFVAEDEGPLVAMVKVLG